MTFLDIRTLLVVVILVLVVRAAIFGYLWRINPDYPPVRFWAIGALLVATGGIFLLLRDEASFLFSMLVANLMILTGWLSWSHGTLLATGTRSPWRVGAAMTMSCYAGIAYFGYADPDFFLRTVFQALPMMVMDIYVAIACMRDRGDPRRMTFMRLGITMLVLTVSNL